LENYLEVGQTPLIPIDIDGVIIWGKAEFMNPSGSVKDRPIKNILTRAVENGLLSKGGTVVEATSGNAGISFAMYCAEMGFKCVIVMPSNMSEERKKMLRLYGAELIEVGPGDFDSAIKLRDELAEKNGWFNGNQFASPWNIEAHKEGTGVELMYQAISNKIRPSAFVLGTGTGGTLMGDGSKFMVDLDFVDHIITISTEEATQMSRRLSKDYGIFVGISAGANVLASVKYGQKFDKTNIFTILCDRGDRYLSIL
jgi:cysteine synthase A